MITVGMAMLGKEISFGQSLLSPRATAVGAYSPLVSDTRDFSANPAGLTLMDGWEVGVTSYLPVSGSAEGFVFHGITVGSRFLDHHGAALQFSNGTSLEFLFPAQSIVVGPDPTTVDTRISYSEKFSAAYAFTPLEEFSLGLLTRYRREKFTDTQYQLVDTAIVRLPDLVQESDYWSIDLGVRWYPLKEIALSLIGRNVVVPGRDNLADRFDGNQLPSDFFLTAGASYSFSPFLLTVEGGTSRTGAIGGEWYAPGRLVIRGGLYVSEWEDSFPSAIGIGCGWTYGFLKMDISYLHFVDSRTHSGTIDEGEFNSQSIINLDQNPYTRNRISLSVSAAIMPEQEPKVRIDAVDIHGAVYPARRDVFAYQPLGSVRVTNVTDQPVNIRAKLFLEGFMDVPTESQPVYVVPGQQVELPLTAIFNDRLLAASQMTIRDAVVAVSSTMNGEDDRRSARVIIHGKNAWDGDVGSLRYFVAPDDPEILRYTRDVLLSNRSNLAATGEDLTAFRNASTLINTFAGQLVYVNDPKLSSDLVQYPSETLALKGGDCDDMSVLISSLLNSMGISTAFIDVVPPGRPEAGHVYLMFDTGLPASRAPEVSENPKRYVVRKGPEGGETVWIPIETTVIMKGFEESWNVGAAEYFDDVEVNLGLIKGWVRLVDVY
jgi:hypothetical protein